AEDLAREHPNAAIAAIRMGVPPMAPRAEARGTIRERLGIAPDDVAFAAFGTLTAEKRIQPMLDALAALVAEQRSVRLLLVGDGSGFPGFETAIAAHPAADRVHVTGYVADHDVADWLAAADACLCLRWPTALETSASWLRCLAARRATV